MGKVQTKICTRCGRKQLLVAFGKTAVTRSGLTARCRKCLSEATTESRKKNPEVAKQWQRNNPERVKANQARYNEKVPSRVRMKRWRSKNTRRSNDSSRIRRLQKEGANITRELLELLQQKQKNRCAICGKPETLVHGKHRTVAALAIDHDHITGQVRGLLCRRCNSGIAHLQESPRILLNALRYLLRFQ